MKHGKGTLNPLVFLSIVEIHLTIHSKYEDRKFFSVCMGWAFNLLYFLYKSKPRLILANPRKTVTQIRSIFGTRNKPYTAQWKV